MTSISPEMKKIKLSGSNNVEQDSSFANVHEFPFVLLSKHIFPFVGNHQYRFVGGVCQSFEKAYSSQFPEKATRFNCRL
jgi:hypothetical protein